MLARRIDPEDGMKPEDCREGQLVECFHDGNPDESLYPVALGLIVKKKRTRAIVEIIQPYDYGEINRWVRRQIIYFATPYREQPERRWKWKEFHKGGKMDFPIRHLVEVGGGI